MSTELDQHNPDAIRATVRDAYAAAAVRATAGQTACCGPDITTSCCGPDGATQEVFGPDLYQQADRDQLPAQAVAASLGCGNPLVMVDLHPGQTVLDLGSGGGIDVLLSARRVGPAGKAFGLDMTDEMLALARRNADQAGATNVEFLRGHIEDIPLPDASVDVVISNCVINLSGDKPAVFRESHRVLTPGGRFAVSDVIADDILTPALRAERGGWVGCIAGALSHSEYRDGLAAAGFTDITISPTHQVVDGMHSAVIRATKPY